MNKENVCRFKNIRVSFKDSITAYEDFINVRAWYYDYGALHILFESGHYRMYPGIHVYYVEELKEAK